MVMMRHRALAGLLALILAGAGMAHGAVLRVACVTGVAGAEAPAEVTLEPAAGEEVAAIQFDLLFNADVLAYSGAAIGTAAEEAGKDLVTNEIDEGHIRVIVSGFNQNVIGEGAVARCTFAVPAGAADGRHPLTPDAVLLANPEGGAVPAVPEAGCVTVGAVAHSADTNVDWRIRLSELLRVIQLYNSRAYHCAPDTEDGYAVGPGDETCLRHHSDYQDGGDWTIQISELLRLIQLYNSPGYHAASGTEDGFAPDAAA